MSGEPSCIVRYLKRKALQIKRWACRHSAEERLARRLLANLPGDPTRDLGVLIAEAFGAGRVMNAAIQVALRRLESRETRWLPKFFQYHRALLFLQKLCMESEYARAAVKHHHLKILPFVFYNRGNSVVSANIRLLSISVLKLGSSDRRPYEKSATTFVTCVSHQSPVKQ